jgi:large subunit ribosomal protein L29
MAGKKAHDLREMTLVELETLAREQAENLLQQRLKLRLRQVDNPLSIRIMRREMAVIKTVINEKRSGR